MIIPTNITMTNCTYLKQKLNRQLECKKQNKIINIRECNECKYREFVTNWHALKQSQQTTSCRQLNQYRQKSPKMTMKKRTYKQAKNEKGRYSIIYDDLSKCCVNGCLTPYYKVEKNEVYEGAKRSASIKYGFICPLCKNHHDQFHNDRDFALYYKRLFQLEFEKTHSRNEFIDIIHYNYL